MIKCSGVNGLRSIGSLDISHEGREFKIASISVVNVDNSSKVRNFNQSTLVVKCVLVDLTAASHNPTK